tara:strand:+ start:6335 stop:6829 length:495 start_codon:yes stop_codon:yes gene_type:complete
MTIRPATTDDATAIAAIWNDYIINTTATFNPVAKTIPDIITAIQTRPFWVCGTNNVQGFASYGPFRAGLGYAHTAEHTIWLHPDVKRMGYGRKLMTALENHAKNHAIHTLIGALNADNTNSIAFHTACGFNQSAHLPKVGFKFDQWHDLVLMQKLLYQDHSKTD